VRAPGQLIGADFARSKPRAGVVAARWKLDSYRHFDATRDLRDEPYCYSLRTGVPAGSARKTGAQYQPKLVIWRLAPAASAPGGNRRMGFSDQAGH
jgi:hypothetical protein